MGMMQGLLQIHPMGSIVTLPRAFVSFTVAATTGTLHALATGRTAIIIALSISRRGGGNGYLQIGEGDFTQRMPDILYINGQDMTKSIDGPEPLPLLIFEANITARATVAAVADNDVRVMATCYEF